jgi:hypothetical protein
MFEIVLGECVMRIVPFTDSQRELLERFEAAGGCVEYVIIEPQDSDPRWERVHRRAAVAAVEFIILKNTNSFSNMDLVDYGKVESTWGQVVTLRQFMGEHWNAPRQLLIMYTCLEDTGQSMPVCAGDKPVRSNVVTPQHREDFSSRGYAYAFSDPPYRLHVSPAEVQILFDAINNALFPDLGDPKTRILEWPGTWSTFFDAGNEWWGAYMWTVERPNKQIVCVAASATD